MKIEDMSMTLGLVIRTTVGNASKICDSISDDGIGDVIYRKLSSEKLMMIPASTVFTPDELDRLLGWYRRLRQRRGADELIKGKIVHMLNNYDGKNRD